MNDAPTIDAMRLTRFMLWMLRFGAQTGELSKTLVAHTSPQMAPAVVSAVNVFNSVEPSILRLVYFQTLFSYFKHTLPEAMKGWIEQSGEPFWDQPLSHDEYDLLFDSDNEKLGIGNVMSVINRFKQREPVDIRPTVGIAREIEALQQGLIQQNGDERSPEDIEKLSALRMEFWKHLGEGNRDVILHGVHRLERMSRLAQPEFREDVEDIFTQADWVEQEEDECHAFERNFDDMVHRVAICPLVPNRELPDDWPMDGPLPFPSRRDIFQHLTQYMNNGDIFNAIFSPNFGAALYTLPLLKWAEVIAHVHGADLPEAIIGDLPQVGAKPTSRYHHWPVCNAALKALLIADHFLRSEDPNAFFETLRHIDQAHAEQAHPLDADEIILLLSSCFMAVSICGLDPKWVKLMLVESLPSNPRISWFEASDRLVEALRLSEDPHNVLLQNQDYLHDLAELVKNFIATDAAPPELAAPLLLLHQHFPDVIPGLLEGDVIGAAMTQQAAMDTDTPTL
ncbi:hypothetical protein GC177_01955 [bacterium]|nr:hypothetical protein [bacterium]